MNRMFSLLIVSYIFAVCTTNGENKANQKDKRFYTFNTPSKWREKKENIVSTLRLISSNKGLFYQNSSSQVKKKYITLQPNIIAKKLDISSTNTITVSRPLPTPTATATDTATATGTDTVTLSRPLPTPTATATDTATATGTDTITVSRPLPTPTATATDTATATGTDTVTLTEQLSTLTSSKSVTLLDSSTPTRTVDEDKGTLTRTETLFHVSRTVSLSLTEGILPSSTATDTLSAVSRTVDVMHTQTKYPYQSFTSTETRSLGVTETVSLAICPAVRESSVILLSLDASYVLSGFVARAKMGGEAVVYRLTDDMANVTDEGVVIEGLTLECLEQELGSKSRFGCSYFLSEVKRGVVLRRLPAGEFELTLKPVPGYIIGFNEELKFSVPVNEALSCIFSPEEHQPSLKAPKLVRKGMLRKEIKAVMTAEHEIPLFPIISVTMQPLPQEEFAKNSGEAETFVSMISVVGAPIGAVGGINYVTALNMMPCAPDPSRRAFSSYRGLSVAAIENSYFGVLIGNLVLNGGVFLIHTIIFSIIMLAGGLTARVAAARCWYPGVSLLFLMHTFVGTCFASMQGMSSKDSKTIAVSVIMFVVFVIGTPIALIVPMIRMRARLYPLSHAFIFRTGNNEKSCVARLGSTWLLRIRGIWLPDVTAQRFFLLMMNLRLNRATWVTLWLWSPLIFSVVSAFPAYSLNGCMGVHAFILFAHVLLFILVLVFRPLISPLDNCYYLITTAVIVIILSCNIALLMKPSNSSALIALSIAAIIAILAFLLYILLKSLQLVLLLCHKWSEADVRASPAMTRSGGGAVRVGSEYTPASATRQEEHSDDEMHRMRPTTAPRLPNFMERTVDMGEGGAIRIGHPLPFRLVDELVLADAESRGDTQAAPPRPLMDADWDSEFAVDTISLDSLDISRQTGDSHNGQERRGPESDDDPLNIGV